MNQYENGRRVLQLISLSLMRLPSMISFDAPLNSPRLDAVPWYLCSVAPARQNSVPTRTWKTSAILSDRTSLQRGYKHAQSASKQPRYRRRQSKASHPQPYSLVSLSIRLPAVTVRRSKIPQGPQKTTSRLPRLPQHPSSC